MKKVEEGNEGKERENESVSARVCESVCCVRLGQHGMVAARAGGFY